jgi:hypothetical protein
MWKQNWVLPRAVWCCDSPQCKPVGFIQVSFSLGSCGHVAAIACASLASYVLYCSLINFKTFMISWLRHEGDVLLEGVCGRLCLEKLFAPVCAVAHGHVQIGARPLRPIQKEHLARRGFSRYLCNYVHIVYKYILIYIYIDPVISYHHLSRPICLSNTFQVMDPRGRCGPKGPGGMASFRVLGNSRNFMWHPLKRVGTGTWGAGGMGTGWNMNLNKLKALPQKNIAFVSNALPCANSRSWFFMWLTTVINTYTLTRPKVALQRISVDCDGLWMYIPGKPLVAKNRSHRMKYTLCFPFSN